MIMKTPLKNCSLKTEIPGFSSTFVFEISDEFDDRQSRNIAKENMNMIRHEAVNADQNSVFIRNFLQFGGANMDEFLLRKQF